VNQKRRSIKEINAQMDKINKRKPNKSQIEELGKVIKEINKKNDDHSVEEIPIKKIAIPLNHLEAFTHDQ